MTFQKARDLFRLQKQAKQARKALRSIHIEAEHKGVAVVITGEQRVLSIAVAEDVPRGKIGEYLTEAFNRALQKAQVVSAEKMKGVMGELGLGGL